MRRPAAFFPIARALGAMILAPPRVGAQAQDSREEGPNEIEQCQTIDKLGSYRLVKNLTAASGADCLDITASFVTIDLAGFSISGSSGGSGSGVAASAGLSDIAVRNGSIATVNFVSGVDLSSAKGSIVEGLRVTGAREVTQGSAIIANGTVKGNTVVGFGTSSLVQGFGISAFGTATVNYVSGNRRGMDIGQGSTVIGTTVTSNSREGIVVGCPSNVTDNPAVNNGFPNGNLELIGTGCNNTNNVAP